MLNGWYVSTGGTLSMVVSPHFYPSKVYKVEELGVRDSGTGSCICFLVEGGV